MRRAWWFLGGLTLLYLMSCGVLVFPEGRLWISPDETATRVFIDRFAQTRTLVLTEPLNLVANDTLFPRSVIAVGDKLLPAGFLGLPVLYGFAQFVLGAWIVPWLTPLLAVAALVCLYDLLKRTLGTSYALIVTPLAATLPAWWYFVARSLMPNVPFVACVLIAWWVFAAHPVERLAHSIRRESSWVLWFEGLLSGLILGAAFLIRPVEFTWLIPVLLVALVLFRRSFRRATLLGGFVGFSLGVGVTLGLHQQVYGSFWQTGYTFFRSVTEPVLQETSSPSLLSTSSRLTSLLSLIFPFGIDIKAVLRHGFSFLLRLHWWIWVFALPGLALILRSEKDNALLILKKYSVVWVMMSVWLVLLYGSWTVRDHPDPTVVSLANSYVRYWLPIVLGALPFVAVSLLWIKKQTRQTWVIPALVTILVLWQGARTFLVGPENLLSVARTLTTTETCRAHFESHLPANAIIVTDRADKLFFPRHPIRQPLRDETTYDALALYASLRPLAYVGITFPPEDLVYLNTQKLTESRLMIEYVTTCGAESLYRFSSL